MIDDTREIPDSGHGPASSRPQFHPSRDEVAKILESSTIRHHASRWASNLRFLTFDDSCEDDFDSNCTTLTTSQNEETPLRGQCQPCARRVPIPSGHMCESHTINRTRIPDRETELHKYADPCVHVREHSCDDCQHIPLFPNELKVTKFRIRRVYPLNVEKAAHCTDFVAVSYCWSSEKNDDKTIPYKVIEEDGRVRDSRASNATIDRVVAFARENGFRMIWIDQECIEQDNPEEKERAIQAMDYVYLRAHTSIALFHAELQQKHLECVLLAYEAQMARFRKHRGRKALHGCRKVSLPTMCEAVSMIINDRWNTRAWILQEAFSSSGRMVLLFPRVKNVNVGSWLLICHELSQSELAVRLDTIQDCLQICTPMILPELRRALQIKENESNRHRAQTGQMRITRPMKKTRQSRGNTNDQGVLDNANEIRTTIKRLQLFHPIAPEHPCKIILGNLNPRRTCNAAVALTYLHLRGLERVVDKLAIIANICSYDRRLNTVELEKTQRSLGACILTLALANGDFSLLIPQIYRSPKTVAIEFPACDGDEFSWLHCLTQNLQDAESTDWNPYGPTTGGNSTASIRLSEKGLSFPGILWNINKFLNLQTLQVKYGDSWQRLRKAKDLSRPSPRTVRLATTHLLFEIIKCLVSMGEKHVANSIFNSTSYWRWNSRDTVTQSDMVESVDQFPPGLQIENRKGMFSLDSSPDGWCHQCWLIDRVMEKGGFWVGSMVKQKQAEKVGEIIVDEATAAEQTLDGGETSTAAKHDHDSDIGISQNAELDLSQEQTSSMDAKELKFLQRGHSSNLLIASLMTLMGQQAVEFSKEYLESMEAGGDNPISSYIGPQSLSIFAICSARLRHGLDDTCQRQAIFDIDGNAGGQTIVLTPFQMTLESIPRPAMRGMSVSWVVETVDENAENGNKKTIESMERFKVKGMTKGMWQLTLAVSGRYEIS
ncbi:heterokaryon incompatibility protein-domain-containing protein [Hypoxylon sp. FL0890]|nr:heterokaryon incompatibility protein-domain-containing protein [Hypoxylon sp. FL0890]